ncbi:MAG: ribosome-associated translation inhibitor RaiA [Lachnospiraceae bacterium]|nr:ribosome-associated translation inhibitor RaiA [Lachnospiraceae bacterium]
MRYIISGKNIEVTEGLKNAIYEKLDKLDKFFAQETECMVTLSVEKFRQKAEVTIPMKGNILRAEEESDDMYVSIDVVAELLERQIRKFKTKITNYNKGNETFTSDFLDQDYEDEEEIKIIRSKKFAIKPMDAEEACIQMELLGHNFYVFRNAETFEVNVVYKRKGNTYGLIEPEF